MKNLIYYLLISCLSFILLSGCGRPKNTSAIDEQAHIETNQQNLNKVQPSPTITWSLERDNLIKRFKMMNDRSIVFYMYVFIEGDRQPIGYYQVNKVSSVNSQLTATQQLVTVYSSNTTTGHYIDGVIESPAEDGSYGSNGNGVFGFSPEDIYLEHNMKYILSSVPLSFRDPVNKLTVINLQTQKELETLMNRIK